MACPERVKLALFAAYIVSIVSALANPANLNFEDAYTLTQGANITTLLLLAYCKRSLGDVCIASVLGVAFAMRATGSWQGGSRWDSLLVTVGMLVVLQHAFYQVVPSTLPHRAIVYLAFTCTVMPVLSALPHLVKKQDLDAAVMQRALKNCQAAYAITKDAAPSVGGPLWKLYDAPTDTRAGVDRVLRPDGTSELYVYFAGSESAENWKTNLNILGDVVPEDWGCSSGTVMRTHQGYTKAFKSVAAKMLTALETELAYSSGDTTRIVFCGHSLGGALAVMAAMYVACKAPRLRSRVAVVTFGAPQVGDGNFVEHFNAVVPTCVRVVNPMDPVPRVLDAQLVHVKGYHVVGTFSFDNTIKAHALATYADAMSKSRFVSVVSAFAPAVIIASLIGLYIAWQMGRL